MLKILQRKALAFWIDTSVNFSFPSEVGGVLWISAVPVTSRTLLPELPFTYRVINHSLNVGLFPIGYKQVLVLSILKCLS